MTTEAIASRYAPSEFGPETEPEDAERYRVVIDMVVGLMKDMVWRSTLEICKALAISPTVRVDSRLRDLRKDKWRDKYKVLAVNCKRCEDGIYRYQLILEVSKIAETSMEETMRCAHCGREFDGNVACYDGANNGTHKFHANDGTPCTDETCSRSDDWQSELRPMVSKIVRGE